MSRNKRPRVALLGHGAQADRWACALAGRADVRPLPDQLQERTTTVDAVILAPGTIDAFLRAREALVAGLPVLYAAPFHLSPWQANVLAHVSRRQNRILRFVEPFRYRRGFAFMQRLLRGREPFWRPLYLRSQCIVTRSETVRLDDLATEELAVCDRLLDGLPTHVVASAARCDDSGDVHAVFLTVQYSSGPIVNCAVSLAEGMDVRQVVAVTRERTLVMDELDATVPLSIEGVSDRDPLAGHCVPARNSRDIVALEGEDAVTAEVVDFLAAVDSRDLTAGNSANWLRVAGIWWAARQSMTFGGEVDVPRPRTLDTTPPPLSVIEGGGGSIKAGRARPRLTVVAR